MSAKPCANCGTTIWRRTLCPQCQNEHDRKKAALNRSANYKKGRLIEERGGRCQQCGANAPLIAHHVIALAQGGTNDDENLMLVCKSCHDALHQKRQRIDWSSVG